MSSFTDFNPQFNISGKRKRKKHLINEIKKQISYYFSDSNLATDEYFSRLMNNGPDGYVSLETIEQFNRIVEIDCSRELLIKSISFLPELQLSEDQKSVRRVFPVNPLYCADDRSIYIENLPPKMDHKRLEQALKKYGETVKISLPRFRNNKEYKGFGFVEFKTVQESAAALKGLGWKEDKLELKPFRSPPRSLSLSKSESITPNTGTPDQCSSGTPDIYSETELFKDSKDDAKKKRRRRRSSICLADLKPQHRDPLLLVSPTIETPLSGRKRKRTSLETVSPIGERKVKRVLSVSGPLEGSERVSDTELRKQMKIVKAKRRKKKKQKEKKRCVLQDIRVFPKKRWLELKTLYKSIQKQQMTEIKQDLGITTVGSGEMSEDETTDDNLKIMEDPIVKQAAKKRRRKIRGYNKIIKKCSAQDQTSQQDC